MYVIFGNDHKAEVVCELLDERDIEYVRFDHTDLKGDLISLNGLDTTSIDSIVLLFDDIEVKMKAVTELKTIFPSTRLTVYSRDDQEGRKLRSAGADEVMVEREIIYSSFVDSIDGWIQKDITMRLKDTLSDFDGAVSIFVHDNPDADAIASAMGFEKICSKLGIDSTTYYSGKIGYPENRELLVKTGFEMEKVNEGEIKDILEHSSKIVFIDMAEPGVNNKVPDDCEPDLIIDHHHTNMGVKKGGYVEIRSDVGATSTMIAQHLKGSDYGIDGFLASSLLYGIKVDTFGYIRNMHQADHDSISYLSRFADEELLDIFESPPLNSRTLDSLGIAISNREIERGILTAYAGEISMRDDIPQIADVLRGERDINVVLIYGLLDDKIYMSARSKEVEVNIGDKMQRAFSDIGQAGGHRHAAGGFVQLSHFSSKDDAIEAIPQRFKKEVLEDETAV